MIVVAPRLHKRLFKCMPNCIAGIHMWWLLEMVAITVQIFPKVCGYR